MIGKEYDGNKIRALLTEQGITPCIPPGRNRNKRLPYSKGLYKMRHKVENRLAKLKDWRPIATTTLCSYFLLCRPPGGHTLLVISPELSLQFLTLPRDGEMVTQPAHQPVAG